MPSNLNRTVRVIESSDAEKRSQNGVFSDYLAVPNIILLGDPGAGKTYTFKAAASEENVDYYTVREFIAYAETSDEQKTIYLDGLDEFRSRCDDKNLIIELIKLLNKQGHPKIRLSCRSADWLGESDLSLLRRFFHDSSFVVLHLEPLNDDEVLVILKKNEVPDPGHFISKAKSLNLSSLLRNPQTLTMLVDVVQKGTWPKTRKELFEQSCSILLEEFNREHTGSGQGMFSTNELIAPAGQIAATFLISGVSGISLLEAGSATDEFPSYSTIDSLQKDKIQACLMRRCFSYVESAHEAVTYIHRTVAEFLGAKWLAGKVRAGHPLSRIQSLIGIDYHPVSELRGLHAWLPVFLPEHAELFIGKDPYGVLMYGDAASLSPTHRKGLLSELVLLSQSDPWFRTNDWTDESLGALSGPDMVDSFHNILSNQDSSFHLRSLILGAISNGPELPQMHYDLLHIVVSERPYDECAMAVEALLRVVPSGQRDIIDLFEKKLKFDPKKACLRSKILSRLYETWFKPEDVLSVCRDILHDTDQHAIGELWGLVAQLPKSKIPEIIDTLCALNTGEDFNGERVNQHIIEYFFERLLNCVLQLDFTHQPGQFWQWLTTLHFLGNRHDTGSDNNISNWLKQNLSLVFEMLELAYEETEVRQKWKFWSDFEQITMHSLVGEDLARKIFERLEAKSTLSEKDNWLYERCGSLIYWHEPEITRDLLAIFISLTVKHPSLKSICEECCRCEIDDWRLEDIKTKLKRQQEQKENRIQNQNNLKKTQEQIATGQHLQNIGFLARVYFGDFSDVDRALSPAKRLRETFGEEFVGLALVGFSAILGRNDLPTPYDVALLQTKNKYYPWWYAVLAGVNEAWLQQGRSLEGFPDDLLKSALAIATTFPVSCEGEKDRKWQKQLLTERPDIVEFVYEEVARTELKHKKTHITVLYDLEHGEETKSWRSRIAVKLLAQFPCCPPDHLKSLIAAGFYDPEYRNALREMAKHAMVTCCNEQRTIWLATCFFIEHSIIAGLLNRYSKRYEGVVWILRDLSQRLMLKETNKLLQLSIGQMESIILIVGSIFANTSRPHSITCGDKGLWDGADFVLENINKMTAIPDKESTEALNRLLQEKAISSYHNHLRHSLANQAVIRREAEYRQPLWAETVMSLKGGETGQYC
jgi:hypothetical protein